MARSAQINVGICTLHELVCTMYIVGTYVRNRTCHYLRRQETGCRAEAAAEVHIWWRTRSPLCCCTWYLSIVRFKSYLPRDSTLDYRFWGRTSANRVVNILWMRVHCTCVSVCESVCSDEYGLKWTHTKLFRLLLNIVRIFMSIKNG